MAQISIGRCPMRSTAASFAQRHNDSELSDRTVVRLFVATIHIAPTHTLDIALSLRYYAADGHLL